MLMEVVTHAAYGIGRRVEQVDMTIGIEVDGKVQIAGWHKLPHAHGASIRAFGLTQWPALLLGQFDVLSKLFAEIGGPLRIVEAQRVEGIQHRMIPHLGTKASLDTYDGHDQLGRHLQLPLGFSQPGCMLTPEIDARIDAGLSDKEWSVEIPRLGLPGFLDRIEHRLAQLCLDHGLLQIDQRDLQILA